ncbi:MAG: hypothetical protein WAJ85_05015 [Candidatus Baltobacteraceae bacterium]
MASARAAACSLHACECITVQARDALRRDAEIARKLELCHFEQVEAHNDAPLEPRKGCQSSFEQHPVLESDAAFGLEKAFTHAGDVRIVDANQLFGLAHAAQLDDRIGKNAHRFGDLAIVRRTTKRRGERLGCRDVTALECEQAARNTHEPLVIANVVHQFADDHDPGEGFKWRARRDVIAIRRLDEADRSHLLEIGALYA